MKLYVGNLPFEVDNGALQEMFTSYGDVESATVVTDRDTGRSRGFGFVEMSDEQARAAMDELNGKDINGRTLTVNEARPRPDRGRGGGGGGGGGFKRGGGGGQRRSSW